jgi:hypothetical protein
MNCHLGAGHVAQLALFIGGIVLTGWAVACGSSSPPDPPVTGFDGVYATESANDGSPDDIAVVVFANGEDYMLQTNACFSADCAELGKYDYDDAAKAITFTNSVNGAQRVVPVEVLQTEPLATDSTLKPQNDTQIVAPGGTGYQINGNGNTVIINPPAAAGTGGTSSIVKKCPPGTKDSSQVPKDTTNTGVTTPGAGNTADVIDPSKIQPPPNTRTASLNIALNIAPQASSDTGGDNCQVVKPPTQIAKQATVKDTKGDKQVINKQPAQVTGSPGGQTSGSPGAGNSGAGMPNGGVPSSNGGVPSSNGGVPSQPPASNTGNGASICSNIANGVAIPGSPDWRSAFAQCMSSFLNNNSSQA